MRKLIVIFLSINIVFLLISCEQNLKKLKLKYSFEIPLQEKASNSKKPGNEETKHKLRPVGFPPARYLEDYFYVGLNGKDSKILKIRTDGQEALILSSKNKFPPIVKITTELSKNQSPNKIKKKVPLKFKSASFNYIFDFAPSWDHEIYVMNLIHEKSKSDHNEKKTNKKNKSKIPKSSPKRYILKFNDKGDYLYKLGVNGKEGKPFSNQKSVNKMICDQNNDLYLILKKDRAKSSKKKSIGNDQYELFRYNKLGQLDLHENNLFKYIPVEKNQIAQIEQIEVTFSSGRLLLLVSYYSITKNTKNKIVEPDYKKLFFLNLNHDFSVQEINTLKGNEKYYSILGITKNDEIYLAIPSYSQTGLTNSYQVLDQDGNKIEMKSLNLSSELDERGDLFSLGSQGEVIAFKIRSNLIFSFYK